MNLLKTPTLQAVHYTSIINHYKTAFPHWDDRDIVSRWKNEFTQIGDYPKIVTKIRQLIKKLDWSTDIHLHKVMAIAIQLITNLAPPSEKLISINELYFVVVEKNLLSVDNLLRQRNVSTRCTLLKQIVRRRRWSEDVGMQKLLYHHLTFSPHLPEFSRKLERIHLLLKEIQFHNTLMPSLIFVRPSYNVYKQEHGSNMNQILAISRAWRNSIAAAQEFLLASSSVISNKKQVICNAGNIYSLLEYLEKKCQAKSCVSWTVYCSYDENNQPQALALVKKSKPHRWNIQVLVTHPRNLIILPLTKTTMPVRGAASSIIRTIARDLYSSGIEGTEIRLHPSKLAAGFYEHMGFTKVPYSDDKLRIKSANLVASL